MYIYVLNDMREKHGMSINVKKNVKERSNGGTAQLRKESENWTKNKRS